MEQKTDAELVALARQGNKDAFGCLIERYQHMVRRITRRAIARSDVACELEQEALLQAYLSLEHLRDAQHFSGWLYGITLNVCRSYLREQKTETLSLESILGGMHYDAAQISSTVLDPQSIAEEREVRRAVLTAVQNLSLKDRTAALLFYYEHYTLQEISALLAVPIGVVKGRLHRARKQLQKRLSALNEEHYQERQAHINMRSVIIDSVREHPATKQHVVILKDETQQVVIWIGQAEAWAIAEGLGGITPPRPMSTQLMLSLLKATGAQLVETRVEALKDDIFYAALKIRTGDGEQEIDARPSDALALAVQVKCPIYVADEVMERCGQALSDNRALPLTTSLEEFRVIDGEALEKRREELQAGVTKLVTSLAEQQARQEQVAAWKEERET